MAPPKSKTWCFTLNNPEPAASGQDLKEHWRESPEARQLLDLECQLIVVGYEVAESGTEHLQGFVTFKNSKTLTAVKKINSRAHWEKAKQVEAAANYCIKDGNYEKIDHRTQGARCDLRAAVETLRAHGLKRLKSEHPIEFLKHPSGFTALDVLNEEERYFKPDVLWLWGQTGTGKSYFARNVYPDRKRWWSAKNLRWWSGYRGEDVAIIDDFRKDFCTFHELLRILDCYPYKVEVKGSHRELNSKMIIITTIEPPLQMYADLPGERLDQLTRRITKVVHATHGVVPPMFGFPGPPIADIVPEYKLTPDPAINRPYLYEEELSRPPAGEGLPENPPPTPFLTPTDSVEEQPSESEGGQPPQGESGTELAAPSMEEDRALGEDDGIGDSEWSEDERRVGRLNEAVCPFIEDEAFEQC